MLPTLVFAPSGWGLVGSFWLPVIFGFYFASPASVCGVGWFVFGWVLGFSRPVSAETFFCGEFDPGSG